MNIPNNNNESNNEISNEKTLKQQENLNQNREENCLYQVVDFSVNGVYLLNKNTNKISDWSPSERIVLTKYPYYVGGWDNS